MTVRELIESLSKIQDQDIRVMTKGYEGGVDDIVIGNGIDNNTIVIPAPIDIALNVYTEWYYGRHERVNDMREDMDRYHIVKAIVL
ncbi:hypothetical protein UFOVP54_115 [uncultured Caudovirales phage]|uniref:Uncharacterized protein n=1 Tax=uncultured Caudovirales phage TaxID=2100421 RepID=A0A6J5KWR9_9CAUD|nr:hypothetical protein UFOVP54_115 [uncultured Caudovirales phage]